MLLDRCASPRCTALLLMRGGCGKLHGAIRGGCKGALAEGANPLKRTGSSRRTAVIVVCTSIVAAPSGAMALAGARSDQRDRGGLHAQPLTTHSKSTSTLNKAGELVATAKCGAHEVVVSGGYKTSGKDGGAAVLSLTADGKSWTVNFYPYTNPDMLTTYAYCAHNASVSAHSKQVSATVRGDNTTVTARCKAGETLVAGGYQFKPTVGEDTSPTYRDYAANGGWSVMSVFNSVPAKLAAYAYCERGVVVKVRSSSSGSIHDQGNGSATATCHKGETLLGGGYTTTPTPDYFDTTGPDLFYRDSYRSGARSWTASAHNVSSASGKTTAFAYCKA
jgi:hypothetical protein